MTLWEGLVLGVVQGLTEFLPISSDGHLVIGQTLFGLKNDLTFDVVLHGATLIAILIYFRRRLIELVSTLDFSYIGKLALGTLPVAIVGVVFYDAIHSAFDAPLLTSVFLLVTGTFLLSLYLRREQDENPNAAGASNLGRREPTWTAALLIGCAQAAAILPGWSRSGSTIVTGIWLGLAPAAAAEFAFLLGIPAITGAIVIEGGRVPAAVRSGLGGQLALGAMAAFVSGLITIRLVFRLLERREFRRFGFYCWAVALAFGAYLLLRPGA